MTNVGIEVATHKNKQKKPHCKKNVVYWKNIQEFPIKY